MTEILKIFTAAIANTTMAHMIFKQKTTFKTLFAGILFRIARHPARYSENEARIMLLMSIAFVLFMSPLILALEIHYMRS